MYNAVDEVRVSATNNLVIAPSLSDVLELVTGTKPKDVRGGRMAVLSYLMQYMSPEMPSRCVVFTCIDIDSPHRLIEAALAPAESWQ